MQNMQKIDWLGCNCHLISTICPHHLTSAIPFLYEKIAIQCVCVHGGVHASKWSKIRRSVCLCVFLWCQQLHRPMRLHVKLMCVYQCHCW